MKTYFDQKGVLKTGIWQLCIWIRLRWLKLLVHDDPEVKMSREKLLC
jgi:hypothetical protein